jgi:hypothetical protein
MRPSDLNLWAKEMMLDSIDRYLDDRKESYHRDAGEDEVLYKQRNRVAKFLGLPEKKQYEEKL